MRANMSTGVIQTMMSCSNLLWRYAFIAFYFRIISSHGRNSSMNHFCDESVKKYQRTHDITKMNFVRGHKLRKKKATKLNEFYSILTFLFSVDTYRNSIFQQLYVLSKIQFHSIKLLDCVCISFALTHSVHTYLQSFIHIVLVYSIPYGVVNHREP